MKKFVWVSFDLGIRGDYEGIYEFLDAHKAKECGDKLAAFNFESKHDLIGDLTKELKKSVNLDKRSRVYMIYLGDDQKLKGRFLFGSRKSPPWAGHAPSHDEEEDIGG